ncbi:FeoB-associated Cys-rich membrane protein [Flavobacterium sp. NKUCC04_CG]|nr:FeoB-associated Cys-rich membrane protein [Flavobacterium sp. NKUCC04_CG]MBW3518446.1 FeoB-associated Cys-rich membrane protein [Flavobacterium sp. NKUCC04_CG]
MNYQEIIAYSLVALAVVILLKKFFWKPKKGNDQDTSCGSGGCGCS